MVSRSSWFAGLAIASLVPLAPIAAAHDIPYLAGVPVEVDVDISGDWNVFLVDDVVTLVSGTICQDADADGLCGEPGDAAARICGFGGVETPPEGGGVWDPALPVVVVVDTVLQGNPATSPCGSGISFGTFGHVGHT